MIAPEPARGRSHSRRRTQHGRHLPVFTDSMLLGEVVRRASETLGGPRGLELPLLWLGNSHHHLDFAGTLSARATYLISTFFGDLTDNLVSGFRRVGAA